MTPVLFKCGTYIAEEVIEANQDFEVTLTEREALVNSKPYATLKYAITADMIKNNLFKN